jgi:hypothetical protein
MSDPYDTAPAGTRFLMCGYDAHPKEFASGDWVRYSDYARLKAEVERLKAENDRLRSASFVTAVPSEDYDKLKQAVSALIEEGDNLWYVIRHYGRMEKSERLDAIDDWLYAKDKANRTLNR